MNLSKQRLTFSKKERLSSRKTIEEVFKSGKAINESPFRLLWIESAGEEKVFLKIAITVPKKNFKKAAERNKIKRLIRESYRLNKHSFFPAIENSEKNYAAMIIYTGREMPDRKGMEAKFFVTLQRFAKEICKK